MRFGNPRGRMMKLGLIAAAVAIIAPTSMCGMAADAPPKEGRLEFNLCFAAPQHTEVSPQLAVGSFDSLAAVHSIRRADHSTFKVRIASAPTPSRPANTGVPGTVSTSIRMETNGWRNGKRGPISPARGRRKAVRASTPVCRPADHSNRSGSQRPRCRTRFSTAITIPELIS